MYIIIFMKSIIQFFIHSFHVLTFVYDQEKSKKTCNMSDKSNLHFGHSTQSDRTL